MKKTNVHSKNGTGLMGYVRCTYDFLVANFGEPNCGPSLDGKVRAEWEYDTPVGVFTIYDYKDTRPIGSMYKWHIGGHSSAVLNRVADRLRSAIVTDREGVLVAPDRGPDAYVKSLGE